MQCRKMMSIAITALAVFAVVVMPLDCARAASKESVLHSFDYKDGSQPYAGLIFDKAGHLYGTTFYGGTYGSGTVFELIRGAHGQWSETVLHSFNNDGKDGTRPWSLIFDKTGNLYGTTQTGGASGSDCGGSGCGTVIELKQGAHGTWTEKVLHSFQSDGKDGNTPYAGLTIDKAGNLYGTTFLGGSGSSCGPGGCGTVFELTPGARGKWTERVLHNFHTNAEDGFRSWAGLIFDTAGNLYGSTAVGGSHGGFGIVFELTPGTHGKWSEKVLYSFNGKDGAYPLAGLILDTTGNLYGTTNGDNYSNFGNAFELKPGAHGKWTEKVLHGFGDGMDGASPSSGGLIFDKAGNLYGTTPYGGTYAIGTVFELIRGAHGRWSETVLYSFSNGADGGGPYADLIFDKAGSLYSTTSGGGVNAFGTVFKLTP